VCAERAVVQERGGLAWLDWAGAAGGLPAYGPCALRWGGLQLQQVPRTRLLIWSWKPICGLSGSRAKPLDRPLRQHLHLPPPSSCPSLSLSLLTHAPATPPAGRPALTSPPRSTPRPRCGSSATASPTCCPTPRTSPTPPATPRRPCWRRRCPPPTRCRPPARRAAGGRARTRSTCCGSSCRAAPGAAAAAASVAAGGG
jgi:hypothetical protein